MRTFLRILALLLGLALAAAGVLLVLEVVAAWVRPASAGLVLPWASWRAALAELTWADRPVLIVAICAAVVGLLLGLVALLAGRRQIELEPPAPAVTVTTTPSVLARLVGRHVRAADDIAAATVTASGRKVTVRASGQPVASGHGADSSAVEALREEVRGRVDTLLDDVPLRHRPKVAVSARIETVPARKAVR